MAARIFLTGATGYIGGEALYQIAKLPARHQVRCLVRDSQKAAVISKSYPEAVIVNGDLDDTSLIVQEAKDADVVFHLASTKHESSSRAIEAGLRHSDRKASGYWIQISGASMFSTPEIKANKYGEATEKEYDDLADIDEILEVVKSNPARVVDNLVLAQDYAKVKTALIPGPLIYGKGHGLINSRSVQAPDLARYTLQKGHSFMVGKGDAVWSNVHIHDLGQLFVLLLEAALKQREGVWNGDGIFLPENGQMSFGDLARQISETAVDSGFIKSKEVKSMSAEEVNEIMAHGAVLLGTNAKLRSSRARRDLGWAPSAKPLAAEISSIVHDEADRLKQT